RRPAPRAAPGSARAAQLGAALEYFPRAVGRAGEGAGVRICMHPDDPPIDEVRGVPRILGTPEAFDRLLRTVPSEHSGITFCQGNFTLMTDDLPALIRRYGGEGGVLFVYLPVRGTGGGLSRSFTTKGQPTCSNACAPTTRLVSMARCGRTTSRRSRARKMRASATTCSAACLPSVTSPASAKPCMATTMRDTAGR